MSNSSSSWHNQIPTFDNKPENYAEFRTRCMLYRSRMRLDKKEDQVALMILGQLTGVSWQACEHLAEQPDLLETTDAFDKLMALLDKRFKKQPITELPDAFEDYFYKGQRKPRETLFDYIQRARLLSRKISEFKIVIPPQVQGWLLLRRAGLTSEPTEHGDDSGLQGPAVRQCG